MALLHIEDNNKSIEDGTLAAPAKMTVETRPNTGKMHIHQ
jgi:hypothetical protein